MSKLIINVEEDIFVSKYPHIISTTLFVNHDGKCFPDNQWTDFTYPVLSTWEQLLVKNMHSADIKFELFFMDGPYKLEIAKDKNMMLTIDCINFRHEKICEYKINCSYAEFLMALYEAIKNFNYALFKKGMNKGEFEGIFNQSIESMKKLKDTIQ